MTEQFKWVDYYEEFASKLLEYRNNRKELIDKIVKVYDSINRRKYAKKLHRGRTSVGTGGVYVRIEMQFQRPVLISGQVFCYNKNYKRGSARFSRLIGHFKCKRSK